MIILGLHFGHDSSISIIKNGKPIICIEIERLHRIKHAIGITPEDILLVLKKVNLKIEHIDFCAVTSTQHIEYLFSDPKKFSFEYDFIEIKKNKVLKYFNHKTINKRSYFYITKLFKDKNNKHPYRQRLTKKFQNLKNIKKKIGNIEDFFQPKIWKKKNGLKSIKKYFLSKGLNEDLRISMQLPIKINFFKKKIKGLIFSHHFAHAAYSFYNSPFKSATILTQDGSLPQGGYWCGMNYYGIKNKLYPTIPHYLHMGKLYEVVSVLLGFSSEEGPGKMMGLAPYGKPTLFDKRFVGNVFDIIKIRINKISKKKYFHHSDDIWTNKWIDNLINKAVKMKYNLKFLGNKNKILEKINVDIASSTQKLLEQAMLKSVKEVKKAYKSNNIDPTSNLCLCGGTILNCPSNSKIYNAKIYKNVFIPPAVHDGGLSLGAAQAAYYNHFEKKRLVKKKYNSKLSYLGFSNNKKEILDELKKHKKFINFKPVENVEKVAGNLLAKNKIIAIVSGSSEIGPRALGHRSILAHPGIASNWKLVNTIKKRELWRPFAPAVLSNLVSKYFYLTPKNSPFMLFTSKVKSKAIPAVTHVDKSSRIQTVDKNTQPLFKILKSFQKNTGLGVLMNTSFNGPGEPIVETTSQALKNYLSSNIDHLIIENFLISKNAK